LLCFRAGRVEEVAFELERRTPGEDGVEDVVLTVLGVGTAGATGGVTGVPVVGVGGDVVAVVVVAVVVVGPGGAVVVVAEAVVVVGAVSAYARAAITPDDAAIATPALRATRQRRVLALMRWTLLYPASTASALDLSKGVGSGTGERP
jgi:hypothetical protein